MRYKKNSFVVVPNKDVMARQKSHVQSVYFWICSFADENGLCYPSRKTLANLAGCSLRSADDAIGTLCKIGILTKAPRTTGKSKQSNLYQIMIVDSDPVPLFVVVPEEVVEQAKETAGSVLAGDGKIINDLIDLFKPMNPAHDRLFRNKSQRAAIERLLAKYGESKVRNIIAAAQGCFGKAYCPTITTPIELEAKLGQLVAAVHKSGAQRPGVVSL